MNKMDKQNKENLLNSLDEYNPRNDILIKLKEVFKFKVESRDLNPLMSDSYKMNNFKITITNKNTKARRSFYFSQGVGIDETDDDSIIMGLVSCFYLDLPYIDLDNFEGLGYEEKEGERVYKNICEQHDKIKFIGMLNFIEELNEDEKESLN